MSTMNSEKNVKAQYSDDSNLSARIKLHTKHSTNKQGFIPWLFEKYQFSSGYRILELGCGNGEQWGKALPSVSNGTQQLPKDCLLVLSDFSEGMVKNIWDKYSSHKNMLAQRIDIQDIPFPDNSFDVIIANHMLYHVPDLQKALSEVRRVLKTGGRFYTSTNGSGGMREYLHNAIKQINPNTNAFTEAFSFNLQNGNEILSMYFDDVQRHDFMDSLAITETRDLIDWIKSSISISCLSDDDFTNLYEYFEDIRVKEGAINIPKEAGLFISVKKTCTA